MPTSQLLRCEPLEDRVTPAAGDFDPTFGVDGKFSHSFDLRDHDTSDVVFQPDGKILLVGSAAAPGPDSNWDFAAVRLNPDGSPDTSFGTGGLVLVPFDLIPDGKSAVAAVAVQPEGKVVLAGTAEAAAGSRDFAAARLNPDGSPDTSFGTGGKVVVPFDVAETKNDVVHAVALQPDGKVVLAGSAVTNSWVQRTFDPVTLLPISSTTTFTTDIAAVRLNPDGSPDPTFGTGGRVVVPSSGGAVNDSEAAYAVAVRPDGKVVLAGWFGTPQPSGALVVRLLPDGSPDPGFGTGGVNGTGFGGRNDPQLSDAAIQPDGRIVLTWSVVLGYRGASPWPSPTLSIA